MTAEVPGNSYPEIQAGKDGTIKSNRTYELNPSHCDNLNLLKSLLDELEDNPDLLVHRAVLSGISDKSSTIDTNSLESLLEILRPQNTNVPVVSKNFAYLTVGLIVDALNRDYNNHDNGNGYRSEHSDRQTERKSQLITMFGKAFTDLDELRPQDQPEANQFKTQFLLTPSILTTIQDQTYDLYHSSPGEWLRKVVNELIGCRTLPSNNTDPLADLDDKEKLSVIYGTKPWPAVPLPNAVQKYMHHKVKTSPILKAS